MWRSETKTTECPFYSGSKHDRYYSDAGEALFYASRYGDESAVICLLAVPGVEVNWRNSSVYNSTPLHIAAGWGHIRIVELLLQHDADVNIKNDTGETAADLARLAGDTELLQLFEQKIEKKESSSEESSSEESSSEEESSEEEEETKVSSEDTTTTRSTTPSTSKSHARFDDETRKLLL